MNELLSIMETRVEEFCRYIGHQRLRSANPLLRRSYGFPEIDRAWSSHLLDALSLGNIIDIEIDHGMANYELTSRAEEQRQELEYDNIFYHTRQRFMIFYIDDGLLNEEQQKRYLECLALLGIALLHRGMTNYSRNTIGYKPFFHISGVDLNIELDMNYVFVAFETDHHGGTYSRDLHENAVSF